MAIELRSLRYVLALNQRLSFSRAADDLGLAQPTLTRAIQAIERQFGIRLFDRDRTGVRPTAQGRLIIEQARALVADADDFEKQVGLVAAGEAGHVRIGMAPLAATAFLASALADRIEASPNVSNEVLVRNVDTLWPLLLAEEIEFFVSAEGQVPESTGVKAETIGYFPVSLIVRRAHPLLNGGRTDTRYPIVIASKGRLVQDLPEAVKGLIISQPNVVEDYSSILNLLRHSDAIWISSIYAFPEEMDNGELAEIPLSDNAKQRAFRMVIYSLERRTISPAARSFRDAIHKRMSLLHRS